MPKSFLAFVLSLMPMLLMDFPAITCDDDIKRPQKQPHIVLILADDLGWNDVSFHGANEIPTPNIDALAYYGIMLHKHYVLPICTPSRAALLTGRYPIRIGMQGEPLTVGEPRGIPLNETLLPQYLQDMGYRTHIVGKWHVGYYTDMHTPTYRGFESFFGFYSGYLKYYNHTINQARRTNGPSIIGHDVHRDKLRKLEVDYRHGYLTDVITDEALQVISNHDSSEPLFLYVSHAAVHISDGMDKWEVRDTNTVNSEFGYIQNPRRRKYAGMVQALDDSIGQIIKALDKADMLNNSIVLFLSDNGGMSCGRSRNKGSNYPLRGEKFTMFEGGIRGVGAVYSPLLDNRSRISTQLMHITDWLPTFYWLAGGNPDDIQGLDGVNQWSALIDPAKTIRDSLLVNIDERKNEAAGMIGDHKLVRGRGEYPDYYGEDSRNSSYPSYNITRVRLSLAGSTLANKSGNHLSPSRMLMLREDTQFTECRNRTDYPYCDEECLFNIKDDPCETKDISADNPEIVQKLRNFLEDYMRALVLQTNTAPEEASAPYHFNGTWMPWRDEEYWNPTLAPSMNDDMFC